MNPKSKMRPADTAPTTRATRQAGESDASVAAKRRGHVTRLFEVRVKPSVGNPALPVAPRRPHRGWRPWFIALLAVASTLIWITRAQQPDAPDPNATPMPAEDPSQTTATVGAEDLSDTNLPIQDADMSATNVMGQIEGQTNAPGRRRRFFRRRPGSGNTGVTAGDSSGGGNATGDTGRPAYLTFSIITQRNIFDPNRSPGRPPSVAPTRRVTVESFALRGTASLGNNTIAVFDGTSSEYHKDAKVADTIAGYKVASITPDSVKLASGTNEIELRVGMQMRREAGGPWTPSESSQIYAATSNASHGSSAGGAATNVDPPAGGPQDEVLKRLMKQREQE